MPAMKRHFVGISETGELLDDPAAFSVEEELMSDKYGMAAPESPAIPYLMRMTWAHPLRRTGWRYVMRTVSTTKDSVWLFLQGFPIWKAAQVSVRSRAGPGWLSDRKLGLYSLVASILFLFATLIFTSGGGEQQPPSAPATESANAQTIPAPDGPAGAAETGVGPQEGAAPPGPANPEIPPEVAIPADAGAGGRQEGAPPPGPADAP